MSCQEFKIKSLIESWVNTFWVNIMSFSDLRDIFSGRLDLNNCVKSILFLKSPSNTKKYLIEVHKNAFPTVIDFKKERWTKYPCAKCRPVVNPITKRHFKDPVFMEKAANKLSFGISRFTEFLSGYNQVDDNIKPVMLHYSMIYLLDFFSRTWLKYERNWGHGLKQMPSENGSETDFLVKIESNGIFPRAVDAFYLLDQSSLFSPNESDGIDYLMEDVRNEKIIKPMKYSEKPVIDLGELLDKYEALTEVRRTKDSNHILIGYAILFIMSSISRYRAEDWFKIRDNKDMHNKFELLQHDFLYEWIPSILKLTILRSGLLEKLQISRSIYD